MSVNIRYLKPSETILIDIRESYEYKMGHIENAINIPNDLLELVPEKYLKKNKVYYLYCDLGIRSEQLSKMLNKKGYKTFSIEGGYKAYKKSNVNWFNIKKIVYL